MYNFKRITGNEINTKCNTQQRDENVIIYTTVNTAITYTRFYSNMFRLSTSHFPAMLRTIRFLHCGSARLGSHMLTAFVQCILRNLYLLHACNHDQVVGVCKLLTGRCPLAFVFPC
jgi:hypothetical protein